MRCPVAVMEIVIQIRIGRKWYTFVKYDLWPLSEIRRKFWTNWTYFNKYLVIYYMVIVYKNMEKLNFNESIQKKINNYLNKYYYLYFKYVVSKSFKIITRICYDSKSFRVLLILLLYSENNVRVNNLVISLPTWYLKLT